MVSRPLTFRLSTASVAFVFTITGGVNGVQTHPLTQHGPHLTELIGAEPGLSEHPGPDDARHHSVLAGQDPGHGSSTDCTCLSVCDSEEAPNLSDLLFVDILDGENNYIRVIQVTTLLIRQDPTSYLFPLPNAPPLQT